MQYSYLRTDVFQAFREIGNGILFINLIEQSMVCVLFSRGKIIFMIDMSGERSHNKYAVIKGVARVKSRMAVNYISIKTS